MSNSHRSTIKNAFTDMDTDISETEKIIKKLKTADPFRRGDHPYSFYSFIKVGDMQFKIFYTYRYSNRNRENFVLSEELFDEIKKKKAEKLLKTFGKKINSEFKKNKIFHTGITYFTPDTSDESEKRSTMVFSDFEEPDKMEGGFKRRRSHKKRTHRKFKTIKKN